MYKTKPKNIFDNIPSLAPLRSAEVVDELTLYLTSEIVNVGDPIPWWREKQKTYPHLSRMALDYLSIPGTC
jgi:hAT family C-terminal dimerisation region